MSKLLAQDLPAHVTGMASPCNDSGTAKRCQFALACIGWPTNGRRIEPGTGESGHIWAVCCAGILECMRTKPRVQPCTPAVRPLMYYSATAGLHAPCSQEGQHGSLHAYMRTEPTKAPCSCRRGWAPRNDTRHLTCTQRRPLQLSGNGCYHNEPFRYPRAPGRCTTGMSGGKR